MGFCDRHGGQHVGSTAQHGDTTGTFGSKKVEAVDRLRLGARAALAKVPLKDGMDIPTGYMEGRALTKERSFILIEAQSGL